MFELHLRSGQVVAFDGRILEVFNPGWPSQRLHIAHLGELDIAEAADGDHEVTLDDTDVTLAFAREEARARARLLAAIADAQDPPARLAR
jgi:hypothetical protein